MAIYMGERYTGHDLIQFLQEQGVPSEIIVYPNTKWRMLYDVMCKLSVSENSANHNILFKIITSFLHPLNFVGGEEESQIAINQFNQWLKYDNLELSFYSNKVCLNSKRSYQQIQEDEEQYFTMVASDTGQAIHLIKSKYLSELVLLKKCYQLLINIVESSLDNPTRPDERLNEAYLKLYKIAENAKYKIFNALKEEELTAAEIGGYKFYKPFRNLYSVEAERLNNILQPSSESIKAKMNAYFGEIVELCLLCDAGDVLDKSETQKLFNEITLYLTELKEKHQNQTNYPPTDNQKQKITEPRPIPIRIVSGKMEIEGLEKGLGAIAKTRKEDKNKFPYKLHAGTRWENFTIKFLDDENVFIQIKQFEHNTDYKEMGFIGRGTNPSPSEAWTFLKVLAGLNGELTIKDPEARDKYKKQKELLAKSLQDYFLLDYDPFYPYHSSSEKSGNSYKIKITLIPPPNNENEKAEVDEVDDDSLGIKDYLEETSPLVYEKNY